MINVFQPSLGEEEVAALSETFGTNWIGRGPKTKEFERAWAEHVDVSPRLVQSVSNCTEGLFAVMKAIGLRDCDNVVMPSISFVGAANAVLEAGARVRFCDVGYRSLNPHLSDIEAVVDQNTRAVVVMHYGGAPCNDLAQIAGWCESHNIYLIEDCACAPASSVDGVSCGTWGDFGIWSFDSMKIMASGDGGMVYAADKVHAASIGSLLFFGLTSGSGFTSKAEKRWWEFDVVTHGRNAVMNDISSTIGLEQLKKLPAFIERRKELYNMYNDALQNLDWLETPPPIPEHMMSSYYLYWVQMETDARDDLAVFLKKNGVYTTFRYYPLHRVEYYGNYERLMGSDAAADDTLCLPLHQGMSDSDVEKVCTLIETFGRSYGRKTTHR